MAQLAVGDKAPDFTVLDQHGEEVHLEKLLSGKGGVFVYFYPKADTRG